MQTGQVPAQVLRRHAGIRQHTEAPRAIVEDELQGLARIVRHGVGQDPQIADAEGIVGTAETDGGPVGAAQHAVARYVPWLVQTGTLYLAANA